MSDGAGDALLYALMLLLPLSALAARRLPLRSTVRMALAWAAIFLVGIVIVNQRERLEPLIAPLATLLGDDEQTVSGSTVRIAMADDGHFWATVTLNGIRRRMLVDSGATITALSAETARAAGVDTAQSPFPTIIETANGAISARTGTVREFGLSGIAAHELAVVVSPAFGGTDVIGMNFLSRLKAWRVEGRTLILQPETDLT